MSHRKFVVLMSIASFFGACAREGEPRAPTAEASRVAEVELESAEGAEIEGKALLKEDYAGVRVVLTVTDATAGLKGVHVHEKGDCSDIRGKSMGNHFSPGERQHGLPGQVAGHERHVGDLGNIRIDENGRGTLEFVIHDANLKKNDANSLLGRSLVVHEGEDKGKEIQPSGGSGDPIACGVIEES